MSRSAEAAAEPGSLLEAHDLVFSGSTCTGGEATTVVTRTGMHTELGRIAALSQRMTTERSPLETQVRRATWIIALVAVLMGAAFLPAGLAAGLGWSAAISFSIGLIVANVGIRFAFYARVSTEDHQNPVASRAWQLARARL